MSILEGYGFKIVARLGLAADIPVMVNGEIGWDTDKKVWRVGDDTSDPARVPTDKSLGDFDFTTAGTFKFNQIDMAVDGTVDGVDVSRLNAANGILVRKGNNLYNNISLVSGDQTLQITNNDGSLGNIDLRIHPSIMALIQNSGYLTRVYTDALLSGTGRQESPLTLRLATTALLGVSRFATNAEAGAGVLQTVALSPANLLNLQADSAVFIYLKGLFQTSLVVSTDPTLSGAGNPGSPLSVVQATASQRGAAALASQVEVNAGVNTNKMITPATLKGLGYGSATAIALAAALGITFPIDMSNLRIGAGPGVVGNPTNVGNSAPQMLLYATPGIVSLSPSSNEQRPINVATLNYYFPQYAVKTVWNDHDNLPGAAIVGPGCLATDPTRGFVYSDGVNWRSPLPPSAGAWKLVSQITMSALSVVSLGIVPKRRYVVLGGTLSGADSAFQVFVGGTWTTMYLTFIGGTPPAPSNVSWPPYCWGAFFTESTNFIYTHGQGFNGSHLAFPTGISMGNWNGNVRSTMNNLAIRVLEPWSETL